MCDGEIHLWSGESSMSMSSIFDTLSPIVRGGPIHEATRGAVQWGCNAAPNLKCENQDYDSSGLD